MKKILIFLISALLLSVSYVNAQVVDGITYQAVAVDEDGKEIAGMDANGNILHSKTMNVRFTIIEGSSSGNIVYQEIHSTNTDPNGLFSVVIGHGEITNDSPNLSILDIDWGGNKHFLKVELDVKNRNEYKLMGIQQMMAVPYALYALNSGKADSIAGFSGDYNDLTNKPNIPANTSDLTNDLGFITSPDDADSDPTNEFQIISISNDTIYLTNGGYAVIPPTTSIDWTNITNIPTSIDSIVNNNYTIDYGDVLNAPTNLSELTNDVGFITNPNDADSDPTNELQILSISNDTIYLSDGGFAKIPPASSIDWSNITNIPTSIDSIVNHLYHIDYTNISNTPDFTGWDTNVADDFDGDYNNLTNQPTIPTVPTNVSAFTNDAGYLTSFTESQILSISNDTIYLTGGSFVKLPTGFSGDYNDLTNQPTIPTVPTNVSAFTNDAGYLTSFTESQILSISNDTIYLTGGSFVKLPVGFSGDYNDLTNQPTIPTVPSNVSAFTNDAGYLTSFTESQILSISNDTIYLTGGSFVKLPASFSGDYSDLTNAPNFTGWDTNVADDFDGDYNNLTNQPTIPTVPTNVSAFTNDVGYINTYTEQDTIIWKKNGNDIYYLVGNVGIGIANPTAALDVYGGISSKYSNGEIVSFSTPGGFPGVVLNDTTLNIRADMKLNNSGSVLFSTGTYASGTAGQTNHLTIKNNGNIGIGNTDPQAKLDVQGSVKIVDGTEGAGKVLTSDADGNASWQTPATSSSNGGLKILETNGTFIVPANVYSLIVEMWGAGGGGGKGGNGTCGSCGFSTSGGGGGSGGYKKVFISVTPGQSITYTIGVGGSSQTAGTSTTFGSNTANGGGAGGNGSGPYTTCSGASVGAAGVAGTGGNNGGVGCCNTNWGCGGGKGGDAANGLGIGGSGGVNQTSNGQNGNDGQAGGRASGGGGGSGVRSGSGGGATPVVPTIGGAGGEGGDGLIIVYW